jgi:hypothetical protein
VQLPFPQKEYSHKYLDAPVTVRIEIIGVHHASASPPKGTYQIAVHATSIIWALASWSYFESDKLSTRISTP